jgi:hypothetical protein
MALQPQCLKKPIQIALKPVLNAQIFKRTSAVLAKEAFVAAFATWDRAESRQNHQKAYAAQRRTPSPPGTFYERLQAAPARIPITDGTWY